MVSFKYMFKNFPLRVVIFKRLRNLLDIRVYKGRMYRELKPAEAGGDIEKRFLVIKKGNMYLETPMPPQQGFYDIDGTQTVYLLQTDVNIYYPVSFEEGVLRAVVPMREAVLDEKGEQAKDESGNLVWRDIDREQVIFDTRYIDKDGRLQSLPMAMAHKTFDKEQWLSQEIVLANQIYKPKKSTLEAVAPYAMLAIAGVIFVILIVVTFQGYEKNNQIMADALKAVAASTENLTRNLVALKGVAGGVTQYVPPG